MPYWVQSGGRISALHALMTSDILRNPEHFGREKTVSLSALAASSDLEGLTDIGFLAQAGYLTIRSVAGSTAHLDYPNEEVRTAMARLYIEQLLQGKTLEQAGVENIAGRLAHESVENVVGLFEHLLGAVDLEHYPVRDEDSLRAFVQVFLAGAGLDPRTGTHGSGLEIQAGGRFWALEFRVLRQGDHAGTLLREALGQAEERANKEEQRIGLALVFSPEDRKIVRWDLCPAGVN